MFGLVLLTVLFLGVVAAAGVVVNCAAPYLPILDTQTEVLCDGLADLGLVEDPLVGVGIAVAGLLAVTIAWRAAFKRWRRNTCVESTGSLVNNIHRLAESSREAEAMDSGSAESHEIWERIDDLEKRMRSSSPGRDVASTWLELLRHANDLHSHGELSMEDFKMTIVRLLDLVSEESDSTSPATVA